MIGAARNPGDAPVFIVGMNGSGTTMLLDHFNSHPDLYGFRLETKVLPYYLQRATRYGELSDDGNFKALFAAMAAEYPFKKVNGDKPVPAPSHWGTIARSPAGIFDYVLRYFAAMEGKTRWCEKSPMHIQHMTRIGNAFPGAHFIHVIRDGRDCAASFHRRWGYTPRSSMYRWKKAIECGRIQGSALGAQRYTEVFYEKLTAQPELELRRLSTFLGIDFDPAMLNATRDTSRVKGHASRIIVVNERRHAAYFGTGESRALETIGGKTLASLGYATDSPEADHNPSPWLLQLWSARDRSRIVASDLFAKLTTKKFSSWSLLQAKFKRALRQRRANRF